MSGIFNFSTSVGWHLLFAVKTKPVNTFSVDMA
jgi:hypothetical protein